MNLGTKFAVTMGVGLIAILLLMSMASLIFNDVQDQASTVSDTSESDSVGNQLWVERNADVLVLAVMIFGGVLGVLALAGGGFKWQ